MTKGTSPGVLMTPIERKENATWKNGSKYKSWLSFWKNNLLARVEKMFLMQLIYFIREMGFRNVPGSAKRMKKENYE